MPALAHTSVPAWAAPDGSSGAGATPATAPLGSSYLLVGVGGPAALVVRTWTADLAGTPDVRVLVADDAPTAQAAMTAALGRSRVGVRVWLAGPVGACLALRGTAVCAGVEDDEMHVAPTSTGAIELFCAHCGAATTTDAGIGEVVPCGACGRGLVIYHHVSRRTGRFLGFMVDAEEAGA